MMRFIGWIWQSIRQLLGHARPRNEPRDELIELGEQMDAITKQRIAELSTIFSEWQSLCRLQRGQQGIEESNRTRAVDALRSAQEDSSSREAWEILARQATRDMLEARQRLVHINEAVERARPLVEQAKDLVESIGLTRRNAALKLHELRITTVSADQQERLRTAEIAGVDEMRQLSERISNESKAVVSTAAAREELDRYLNPEVTIEQIETVVRG